VSVLTIAYLSVLFEFAAYAQPFGDSFGTQCHLQHVQDHGRQVTKVYLTKPKEFSTGPAETNRESQQNKLKVLVLRSEFPF